MTVFKLYERFSVWAGQSLNNFATLLDSEVGRPMTLEEARIHLKRMAIQQSGGRANSWEAAAHEAMRGSDWYLEEHLGLT